MPAPSHDEAVDALMQIRRASDLADIAEGIALGAKSDAKAAKLVAEAAGRNARGVARALTRPLPLFDEADGLTPAARPKGRGKAAKAEAAPEPEPGPRPLPWEATPVADLAIPAEAVDALEGLGIRTVGLMVKFMRAGCDWEIVPGMDAQAAGRIDSALIDFLERNRPAGEEGRAA